MKTSWPPNTHKNKTSKEVTHRKEIIIYKKNIILVEIRPSKVKSRITLLILSSLSLCLILNIKYPKINPISQGDARAQVET